MNVGGENAGGVRAGDVCAGLGRAQPAPPARSSRPAQPVSRRAPAPLGLLRHAQPLIAPGLCYGQLDVPADPAATQASAQALLRAWDASVGAGPDAPVGDGAALRVRHSPLKRCVQLAQALQAQRPGWTLKPDARLTEMDFGRWEGQAWSSLQPAEWAAWMADFWAYRCGGGQSLAQFWAPVAALWAQRQRAVASGRAQPELWVTHGGVLRVLALLQAGVPQVRRAADWPAHTLAYGQWAIMSG